MFIDLLEYICGYENLKMLLDISIIDPSTIYNLQKL